MGPVVTFRGLTPNEQMLQRAFAEEAKLARKLEGLCSCEVVVEQPHRNRSRGRHYRVTVQLRAAGEGSRRTVGCIASAEWQDAGVAIKQAFAKALRLAQARMPRRTAPLAPSFAA